MRAGCYSCVRKHLGEAAIFETEFVAGYPDFDIYVVGCLSHAAMEAHKLSPELARCIREWRLAWEENTATDIPYEALGRFTRVLEAFGGKLEPPADLWPPEPEAPANEGPDTV